jgi:hypothetical protein
LACKNKKRMASWADMCEDEEPTVWIKVKPSKKQPKKEEPLKEEPPKEDVPQKQLGPNCYCGEPSSQDVVKKAGKREKIGTAFVACASGTCKYWFTLPVPDDMPLAECLCGKPAAACKVKNPESRFFGRYILTCAFGTCKFYKVPS